MEEKKLELIWLRRKLWDIAKIFHKSLSENEIEIYFEVLSAFSQENINYSLMKCLQTCKYFPKPAEIYEISIMNLNRNLKPWLKKP